MGLTDAQKKWHRDYYNRVRKHDKQWLANNEKKKQERRAKSDPNVEREYHQERYFRFRGRFRREDLWHGLSSFGVASLVNPEFVFIYRGQCVTERLRDPMPRWKVS